MKANIEIKVRFLGNNYLFKVEVNLMLKPVVSTVDTTSLTLTLNKYEDTYLPGYQTYLVNQPRVIRCHLLIFDM